MNDEDDDQAEHDDVAVKKSDDQLDNKPQLESELASKSASKSASESSIKKEVKNPNFFNSIYLKVKESFEK